MEYRPLDASRNEIRLLVLPQQPMASHLPVHSRLEHFSLDAIPPNTTDGGPLPDDSERPPSFPCGDYAALSYVWGLPEPANRRRIFVNGRIMTVTANLEAFIRTLRELPDIVGTGGADFKLWVDAICINQNDLKERSQQVKRMRDIYARARTIVVWLGKGDEDSHKALGLIQSLSKRYDILEDPALATSPFRPRPIHFDQGTLKHLYRFFNSPYWQRLWIIQELAMGTNDTPIVCGEGLIRWGEVYRAAKLITGSWKLLGDQVQRELGAEGAEELFKLLWLVCQLHEIGSKESHETKAEKLSRALRLGQNASATEMKDKVYGLLGVLDPTIAAQITPDYMQSIREIYIDFAMSIIRAREKLDIILMGSREGLPAYWPSWVPDWRRRSDRDHIVFGTYRAGGDYAVDFSFSNRGGWLICQGFRLPILARRCGVQKTDGPRRLLVRSKHRFGQEEELTSRVARLWMSRPDQPSQSAKEKAQAETQNPPDEPLDWFLHGGPNQLTLALQNAIVTRRRLASAHDLEGMIEKSMQALERISTATSYFFGRQMIAFIKNCLVYSSYGIEESDIICILLGCDYPVILRPHEDRWKLIGECYVYQIMLGEGLEWLGDDDHPLEEFVIC